MDISLINCLKTIWALLWSSKYNQVTSSEVRVLVSALQTTQTAASSNEKLKQSRKEKDEKATMSSVRHRGAGVVQGRQDPVQLLLDLRGYLILNFVS